MRSFDGAGRIDPHLGGFPQADAGAELADQRRRRHAAGFDVGRKADAAQLAVALGFALALAEAFVVVDLQRLLQRSIVVAGVVERRDRCLIRERLDEILLAQVGGIHAELAGADFDQPFDDVGRFRTSGAAIGVDRHGVGIDRVDLAIDVRDLVLARQQGGIEEGRHRRREGRHIGAEIGGGVHLQAGDLAVAVERHLRLGDVVAAVGVGDETFRALAGPLHRPVELARRPQANDLFRIDENLRAEAAADVGGDDAQFVLGRHADEGGDDQAGDMRVLRRVPQGQVAACGIVFGQRRARLHGVRHQPVVDEFEFCDVLGVLEGGFGRGRVADVPVVDGVVRRAVVNERRAFLRGFGRIDHGGQRLVIDNDFLGGVLRLRQSIGDHHRDRVADIIGLAGGERGVRRHLHRRAVLRQHRPAANQIAELVLRELLRR